jgi:hypothetical protein
MDHAAALLPAAPPFFKLTGAGVFGVAAFAFLAVAAVEFQWHTTLQRCTPLHAGKIESPEVLENSEVARDGIEPPTPAFSGLLSTISPG